jgi:hypothetical protein
MSKSSPVLFYSRCQPLLKLQELVGANLVHPEIQHVLVQPSLQAYNHTAAPLVNSSALVQPALQNETHTPEVN